MNKSEVLILTYLELVWIIPALVLLDLIEDSKNVLSFEFSLYSRRVSEFRRVVLIPIVSSVT